MNTYFSDHNGINNITTLILNYDINVYIKCDLIKKIVHSNAGFSLSVTLILFSF